MYMGEENISKEKVRGARMFLKNGKARGIEGMECEVKSGGEAAVESVHGILFR